MAPVWVRLILAIGLALFGADVLAQPARGQRGSLQLHVGQGRLLHIDAAVRNVLLGDSATADVQVVSEHDLYVYGRKVGQTTLSVTDADSGVAAQLLVNVDRTAAAAGASLPRGSAVSLTFTGDRLVVRGSVADLGQALDARATAQAFNRDNQPPLDQTRLAGAQQVTLRVRVAELSRSTLTQLGLNLNVVADPGSFAFSLVTGSFLGQTAASTLSTSLAGGVNTSNFGQTSVGVTSRRVNANALLNALESEGLLVTLAEPNLTTISGETASFLAGGEVPIPVPQALGVTTIEYKRFGVQLSFTPTLLPGGRIAMRVHPSVSELSSANSVSLNGISVPSFIQRDAQTNVEMASGQTLAIAGLFQRTEQDTVAKFPVLGDLPVIGALFRSVSYQRNETELVILVTPFLTQPISDPQAIPLPGEVSASQSRGQPSIAAGFIAR